MKHLIYMDNQSTTPMDPRAREAMEPFYEARFGNAASRSHAFGRDAEVAVEAARAAISALIGAEDPKEIVFTSGATESNNLALKGVSEMYRERGDHIITVATEHKSVLDTCQYLEEKGFCVTRLGVERDGLIRPDELERAVTKRTILISVMHVNNETGVIQPVTAIGALAKKHGILFHSDAAQSAGKIPLNVQTMKIDLASLSAHKMYGPKGAGALYVRKQNPRVRLVPVIHGGGHEEGLRSGTLNVPGIVGFGKAAQLAVNEMEQEQKKIYGLRERLRVKIEAALDQARVNGSLEHRIAGNLNMSFRFIEGESLLKGLAQKIAVSSGAACTSAAPEPSYVLNALGVPEEFASTSIRFGLGRFNSEADVDRAAGHVIDTVRRLRNASPVYADFKRMKADEMPESLKMTG